MRPVGMSWEWFNSFKSYRHVNLITIPTQAVPLTVCILLWGVQRFGFCFVHAITLENGYHTIHTHFQLWYRCTEAWVANCMGAVLPLVLVCAWLNISLNVSSFFIYSLCKYTFVSPCFASVWIFILQVRSCKMYCCCCWYPETHWACPETHTCRLTLHISCV